MARLAFTYEAGELLIADGAVRPLEAFWIRLVPVCINVTEADGSQDLD